MGIWPNGENMDYEMMYALWACNEENGSWNRVNADNVPVEDRLPSGALKGMPDAYERDREERGVNEINAIVGVSEFDDPNDVDEAYGEGTYRRLFPSEE
jgi:hypothetical protein